MEIQNKVILYIYMKMTCSLVIKRKLFATQALSQTQKKKKKKEVCDKA